MTDEHHHDSSGPWFFLAVLLIAILIFGLFYFGLPALRGGGGTQIRVPEQIDVNINR